MFILEQKYGNDGYAFWFKLLEIIGSTEGHYIRLENIPDWEFLQAKTHLDGDKCKEILDLLSQLGAIDTELWEQKIVWSDNFLKHIADAYKNRRVEMPIRPSFYRQKPKLEPVSTEINPQTKLKETKLKETKVNYAKYVSMFPEEYQKLCEEFGEEFIKEKIEDLNNWKGGKGKRTKDDYLTIRAWIRKDKKGEKNEINSGNSWQSDPYLSKLVK